MFLRLAQATEIDAWSVESFGQEDGVLDGFGGWETGYATILVCLSRAYSLTDDLQTPTKPTVRSAADDWLLQTAETEIAQGVVRAVWGSEDNDAVGVCPTTTVGQLLPLGVHP